MSQTQVILKNIWSALRGPDAFLSRVHEEGIGALSSSFAVSDFAAASIASAGLALSEFLSQNFDLASPVHIDRRLASFWFAKSIRPIGWSLPPQWDPMAGNYQTRDGFIRLHTNAAHHREASLKVLDCAPDAASVARAVSHWSAESLQEAIVAQGGVAAKMYSEAAWTQHEQGHCVALEPLIAWNEKPAAHVRAFGRPERPLEGLRVLDLTRILAGPIATRFLAGFGADVLRIDPPLWDEPAVLPEVTPGKRRARLDLRQERDRAILTRLLTQADVLVHGFRSDALENLGFGEAKRHQLNPHLIDVALNAYGWTGPWAHRRGFDTIVQMSAGLAEAEMCAAQADFPQQLPVQVLDYGTGHMMAAAVIRALCEAQNGSSTTIRFSLARTAAELSKFKIQSREAFAPETEDDLQVKVEETFWGSARRLKPPLILGDVPFAFSMPAGPLGVDAPAFGGLSKS